MESALVPATTSRNTQVLVCEPRLARQQPGGGRDLPAAPVKPAVPVKPVAGTGSTDATVHQRRLTLTRRAAITAWALVVAYRTLTDGLAFNRELLLLYIATGLIAASIGRRHKTFAVVRDWFPFALVLVVYDLSRGAAALVGARTLWHFQPQTDRWLFFGTVPTVWLQERIKMPQPPWWEVIISGIYMSFFVLPYVVAGVLWLRNRSDWAAFVRRFVVLSFVALVVYIVLPAAPPWAAARCTPADIAAGPSSPHCMFRSPAGVPHGGLLGAMHKSQPGAHLFVERISTRGWGTLHLQSAGALLNSGQASVNLVAAIPSLHAAVTAMISVFLWRRVKARWRPLLVAYPLAMAFVLVYSAEHFVIDILLGWALAAIVSLGLDLLEFWWSRRRASKSIAADLAQPGGDLGGGLAVEGAVDAVGDVTDVRGGDHGVQRPQWVVGRQRLGVEDVETGPGEPARPQSVDERFLVDDRAAGCVD
jgi:PAP2 superfamily